MFGRGLKIFTLFGFPVRIDASWLIIALLVTWSLAVGLFPQAYPELTPATYWAMGVIAALGLFASIVVHEFGHALVARRHGLPMRGITLFIFGGVAEMGDEPPTARAEFQVAIAGPIVSVVVGVIGLLLAWLAGALGWPTPVEGVFAYIGGINLLLVVFNLIPAFPLDGGRVLRSALWHWQKSLRKATRITSTIGMGFGIALIVLGVLSIITGNFIGGLWWVLIGLFLRSAAQMSYQQLLVRRALEGEAVHRFMTSSPITVPPSATIRDVVENYMYRHHHRMYPVTENGSLLGCVSTRDVQQIPREEWDRRTVREVARACTADNTITPDADAVEALRRMQKDGASRLLVVDEHGGLQGTLTLKDLLRFLALKMELEEGVPQRVTNVLRRGG